MRFSFRPSSIGYALQTPRTLLSLSLSRMRSERIAHGNMLVFIQSNKLSTNKLNRTHLPNAHEPNRCITNRCVVYKSMYRVNHPDCISREFIPKSIYIYIVLFENNKMRYTHYTILLYILQIICHTKTIFNLTAKPANIYTHIPILYLPIHLQASPMNEKTKKAYQKNLADKTQSSNWPSIIQSPRSERAHKKHIIPEIK